MRKHLYAGPKAPYSASNGWECPKSMMTIVWSHPRAESSHWVSSRPRRATNKLIYGDGDTVTVKDVRHNSKGPMLAQTRTFRCSHLTAMYGFSLVATAGHGLAWIYVGAVPQASWSIQVKAFREFETHVSHSGQRSYRRFCFRGSVSRATSESGHVGILFALTARGESKREFTQNKGAPVAFGHHNHNCVRETY